MKITNGWIDTALDPVNAYAYKSMDRQGHKPTIVALHETGGGTSAQGIASWFATPLNNNGTAASAHIIIDSNTVVQGISLDQAAWSNGGLTAGHAAFLDESINPNLYTISIEFVNPDINNNRPLTDGQYNLGAQVITAICDYYGIPKRRATDARGGLLGHKDIDPQNRPNCPGGQFDWNRMVNLLNPPSTANRDRALKDQWESTRGLFGGTPPRYDTGIASAWRQARIAGKYPGAPISLEYRSVTWNGKAIVVQEFSNARCEWDGTAHWYGI